MNHAQLFPSPCGELGVLNIRFVFLGKGTVSKVSVPLRGIGGVEQASDRQPGDLQNYVSVPLRGIGGVERFALGGWAVPGGLLFPSPCGELGVLNTWATFTANPATLTSFRPLAGNWGC
mgnify:CR=1 FL=1